VTSGGKAISESYDTWGRVTGYTDGLGTNSSKAYDSAGNVATFNDGTATYTYQYDSHNILIGVDGGGGVGSFSYAYKTDGAISAITYPNGTVGKRSYNEIGDVIGLSYSQGSTALLSFSTGFATQGRVTSQSSSTSAQQFTYDGLGRLTKTEDTRAGGCVTRVYGFDASSNRADFRTYGPNNSGGCQTGTPSLSRSSTYDSAGRISNAGYTYDGLGRTLTIPGSDTGTGSPNSLAATYHADDMVATLNQSTSNPAGGADTQAATYGLDPVERINTILDTTNGTETRRLRYRYADGSDSPVAIDSSADGGASWTSTRYVTVPGVGLAASVSGGSSSLQLSNPHGDVVASMASGAGTTTVTSYNESDEYGNPVDGGIPQRFSWLGAESRSHDALGGLVLMGARLYNPNTGLFAQMDPVAGGGASQYGYPYDPINMDDRSGTSWHWGAVISARRLKNQGQLFVDTANSISRLSPNKALHKMMDFISGSFAQILLGLGLSAPIVRDVVHVLFKGLQTATTWGTPTFVVVGAVNWAAAQLRDIGNTYLSAAKDAINAGSDLAQTGIGAGKFWVGVRARAYNTCYQPIYEWKVGT
jgi:RHS repeat-associated protein